MNKILDGSIIAILEWPTRKQSSQSWNARPTNPLFYHFYHTFSALDCFWCFKLNAHHLEDSNLLFKTQIKCPLFPLRRVSWPIPVLPQRWIFTFVTCVTMLSSAWAAIPKGPETGWLINTGSVWPNHLPKAHLQIPSSHWGPGINIGIGGGRGTNI